MTIGDIDLGVRPVLLAPMEDVTDASLQRDMQGAGSGHGLH